MRRLLLPLIALALLIVPATASAKTLRAPTPSSPASGARVEGVPAIAWSAVKGAVVYEYQIAADPEFGSVVLGSGRGKGADKTTNTAATLTSMLPGGEYFWRARAIDASDHSGRWSATASFTREWTTAPNLETPGAADKIAWPSQPLVLRWSAVPFATEYIVTIATDPSLSNPVIGVARDPARTQGTSFTYRETLAPGDYYWAITPVDADGHPGQRSSVRSFTWTWPTKTTPVVADANPLASVYDPLFSWDPVPGASSYEVEVNTTDEWAPGSKICCTDRTVGTSLSPSATLKNNTYFWRLRAIDAAGNPGDWNVGSAFVKDFDAQAPSIPNLRVRDNTRGGLPANSLTSTPIIAWDPVPGASSYTLQRTPYTGAGCDWSASSPTTWTDSTSATAWTAMAGATISSGPVPVAGGIKVDGGTQKPLLDGVQYCVRVRARSDRSGPDDNGFVSDWTQIGGLGQPAFTYEAPAPTVVPPPVPFATPAANYLSPVSPAPPAAATRAERLPVFTWNAVPGASGYWVVVAKDPSFTTVIDYAFTPYPNYAPGSAPNDQKTYTDELSDFYWCVIPATAGDGTGASTVPSENSPMRFQKRSVPPVLTEPSAGPTGTQTTFRWATSEGARRYRLQVSQDASFGTLVDDVTTSSTAYTSATTYPADTTLYWRVGGVDENNVRLTWSPAGTFRRVLPVPSPVSGNPAGGIGIPVLSWTPVPGATSYDVHVDWVNGKQSDISVASTAFAPIAFYGNGIWRWKVRANFPTGAIGRVSGGYFPAQDYVRRMDRTPNVRGTKTSSRVLLTWDPDPAAKRYRVEISQSNGFGRTVDQAETKTTSFAPDFKRGGWASGGTLYWRVASVDEGRNVGAWTTGRFVLPKSLRVSAAGRLRKGLKGTVTVTVRDGARRPVRGARVRVTGRGLVSAARRTDSTGAATFSLRPRRAATLTVTVTRKGYRDAATTLRVQ